MTLDDFAIFDSHFHIIDQRYPLQPNQGYLPDEFTVEDYLTRMRDYRLCGGAVVSGSFQGFDQEYLVAALRRLGPAFVGVTQLPHTVSDQQILALDAQGVRAVRFNLRRGGSEDLRHLASMAARIHGIAGWHVELYVDAAELPALYKAIVGLPAVSVDHLGLRRVGFNTLLRLAERGVRVKASGFGRVDFPVAEVLRELHAANPRALLFGSDLPSTRAPRPYSDGDYRLIVETLGEAATAVLSRNALDFYRVPQAPGRDPSGTDTPAR